MGDVEAWVGTCHVRDMQDSKEDSIQCVAVVYAQSHDEFETILQTYFKNQFQDLLKVEDGLPIMGWLQKHGHNDTVMGLANTVNAKHPVALGAYEKAQVAAPLSYLSITEHQISPLPDQSSIPIQYKEWIASELKAHLFGHADTGAKLRTYFILDPTLRKNVTGVFDLDSDTVDVPIKCLFKGDKAEELKEAAPYLLDMTLPEGGLNNPAMVPNFHKDFFEKHWTENTGIFIRTTAQLDDVWNHFRKFTKVQMEEDKRWVFFRFWDPRTVSIFMKVLDEKDTHKFFASHQIVHPVDGGLKNYRATTPINKTQHAALPPFIMKETYMQAFSDHRTAEFIDKLNLFISEESDDFAKLDQEKKTQLLKTLVTQSHHFNIKVEQAVANFVLASVQFGKNLVDEPKFERILTSEHHELDKTKTLLQEVKEQAA